MISRLPLLGFVAWSGTGKTTLLERLIPLLGQRGLRLGVLKHTHHDFDMDQPGKDSYRLRKAGARQVMAASSRRHARIVETPDGEPPFSALLAGFDWAQLDLLLIEGFKHEHFPKIELHRSAIGRPLLFPEDGEVMALVSDSPQATTLPQFDFEALPAIADFICAWLGERQGASPHQDRIADHDQQPPAQAALLASQALIRQPLRLSALAMEAIHNPAGDGYLPAHLGQDANGILQVSPTSAFMPSALPAANCLIELDPSRPAIAPGERVWVRPLAGWMP